MNVICDSSPFTHSTEGGRILIPNSSWASDHVWSWSPLPPVTVKFQLQSNMSSWGEAHDAWVSSQLFIEQYQLTPTAPHRLLFDRRLSICCVSIERTTALHLPQLALQQRIHSTSVLLFLPLVTAVDGSLVSALSAVFNFFVHNFTNDFWGSSTPSL